MICLLVTAQLKWVFKLKKDEKGAVTKHKVRLVAVA